MRGAEKRLRSGKERKRGEERRMERVKERERGRRERKGRREDKLLLKTLKGDPSHWQGVTYLLQVFPGGTSLLAGGKGGWASTALDAFIWCQKIKVLLR